MRVFTVPQRKRKNFNLIHICVTSNSGVNSPFLPLNLSVIPNNGGWDGTFQCLLYKGQRLVKDLEVKADMEITFEEMQNFQRSIYRGNSQKNHLVYVSKYIQH